MTLATASGADRAGGGRRADTLPAAVFRVALSIPGGAWTSGASIERFRQRPGAGRERRLFGKSCSEVSPIGLFIVNEYKEFDAIGRQILEADLQHCSQQARPNPAPGIFNRNSSQPNAKVGAADALQNGEPGNVRSIACHQISAWTGFRFRWNAPPRPICRPDARNLPCAPHALMAGMSDLVAA